MPLWRLGKLRESLTVSSEVYKKQVLRYLAARGYYLSSTSDVEATFADSILTRKGEKREYWLEVKATDVSLGDSTFISQLAKYLAAYLSRTRGSRFRMILACYKLTNVALFEKVFERLDPDTINALVGEVLDANELNDKLIIAKASTKDIFRFFEDTIIIESDFKGLEIAQEKVKPTSPGKPNLSDAEYAAEVMAKFGDVSPLKCADRLFLNLFQFDLPSRIQVAKTNYKTRDEIFGEKPYVRFPFFDLKNGQVFSFDEFTESNPLSDFVLSDTITSLEVAGLIQNHTEYIITRILNRWIIYRCKRKHLDFDEQRTRAFYYPRSNYGSGLVTAGWKPELRFSVRELTKPMKTDGKINFWVHRGARIFSKLFCGEFYIQIEPRFLFSSDGINLFGGARAARLDRYFRKSNYNRNLNQLYDVRFWCRHVFPETENPEVVSLTGYLGFDAKQPIRIGEQVSVDSEWKPNSELAEDIEALDKIESSTEQLKRLDDYLGE